MSALTIGVYNKELSLNKFRENVELVNEVVSYWIISCNKKNEDYIPLCVSLLKISLLKHRRHCLWQ
jgi:hypothetical protein